VIPINTETIKTFEELAHASLLIGKSIVKNMKNKDDWASERRAVCINLSMDALVQHDIWFSAAYHARMFNGGQ